MEGETMVNYEDEEIVMENSNDSIGKGKEHRSNEVLNDKMEGIEIETLNNNSNNNTNNTNKTNQDGMKMDKSKESISKIRIDRKRTCPFMVKMYCRINGHHRSEEFKPPRFPVEDEMIVYTWKDATLKELSLLVREVLGEEELPGGARGTDANLKFSFNLLYPDNRKPSTFTIKPMGLAFEGGENEARAHQLTDSSQRTLESFRFLAGDFIDVAIYTNPAMIPKFNNFNNNTNNNRKIFYSKRKY